MGYNNEIQYFKIETGGRTREEILARIAQLDLIIKALQDNALTAVSDGSVVEYEIDTGQSKQKVKYTDVNGVINAIAKYEALRTYYRNKITPRKLRAIPGKNMNSRNR